MKKYPGKYLRAILLASLALSLPANGLAAEASGAVSPGYQRQLSANIPLSSYIYGYLDKLDGLGYLKDMQTGAKPYTRMQAARWVEQIKANAASTVDVPDYARQMIAELETEFARELAVLKGTSSANSVALQEWSLTAARYNGQALPQHRTKSAYQPLNINNNGYRLAEDLNGTIAMRLEGKLNDHLVVSATPRVNYDKAADFETSFESAYVKTHINNVEIQVGKDALWWGQGQRGSLLLTNNAEPQKAIKLSNIEPVKLGGMFKFLGSMNSAFFYSELEKDRNDVKYPSLVGFRSDFTPSANFAFGVARVSMVGGQGHMLNSHDYWNFITGKNAYRDDKWNSIGGFDFKWRLPELDGLQLYGEIYGEDQAGRIPPLPSHVAWTAGAYIPRLTPDGDWDARFEAARTSNVWYGHSLYTEGYTYKGDIIGDAMGNNAERCYSKFTRYLADGSRLAFHAEHVAMDKSAANPQKVNSFLVSYETRLEKDLTLKASAGVADIKNLNYQAGKSERDYLVSIGLVKRY